MERKTKIVLIRNILLVILFIGILAFISVKYTPFIVSIIKDTGKFRDFILSYGSAGVLVYIFLQFIHIVIPFIPGEFIQIAGGYIYGTFFGTIYSIIGTVVGTIFVFYISRALGYPLVKIFVSKKNMDRFSSMLNGEKAEIAMFALFMFPGIPKDTLIYMAGLTPIKPIRFMLISLIARSPGLIGSSFIGSNILEKDYKSIVIFSIAVAILFTFGLIFRKKILSKLGH